jgi:hypothetical protein
MFVTHAPHVSQPPFTRFALSCREKIDDDVVTRDAVIKKVQRQTDAGTILAAAGVAEVFHHVALRYVLEAHVATTS